MAILNIIKKEEGLASQFPVSSLNRQQLPLYKTTACLCHCQQPLPVQPKLVCVISFCNSFPSALTNGRGGGEIERTKKKRDIEKGERWQFSLFGLGAASNEAAAQPVIVPAAAANKHTQTHSIGKL